MGIERLDSESDLDDLPARGPRADRRSVPIDEVPAHTLDPEKVLLLKEEERLSDEEEDDGDEEVMVSPKTNGVDRSPETALQEQEDAEAHVMEELLGTPETEAESVQAGEDIRRAHEKYRRFMDDRNDGLPRIHSPWGREPKGKHKKGGDTIRRSGNKS
jgi:hypothetical protein